MTPAGTFTLTQLEPPLSEVMIEGRVLSLSPTATHVVELGELFGAHETALTLVSGENDAVVCH
jgi:hypothetical protein